MSSLKACPECGNVNWNDLGCMTCGLEFFPPSEAYWAASTLTLSERIARLYENPEPEERPRRTRAESPIEKRFREAAAPDWWPELTLVQEHPVQVDGQNYRIDFAVPAWHFGIELDGFRNHSSTADIAKDRKRQRALERAGWTLCRFGGQEVTKDAANCVWEAKAALCGLIADRASAIDRDWFNDHPDASEYFRALIPGEFPQVFAPTRVKVMATSWGRVRKPCGPVIGGAEPPGAKLKVTEMTSGLMDAVNEDIRAERTARSKYQFGGPERWSR